jgi:hypothetical protein
LKLTSLKVARAAETLDAQDLLAELDLRLREQVADLAADHGLDEIGVRDAVHVVGADVLGVAEDGHARGQRVHVLKAVGDEDDGGAVVAELARDAVELLGLALGERGGRLVHDDDAGVHGQRLRDLDHLLLGHGERAHDDVGAEVGVELLQELVGLLEHLLPENDRAPALFMAHENVLRHGQVRIGGHVLVDGGDAGLLRLARVAEMHGLAVEEHFPFLRLVHARDHLDECGLACAVFAHQCMDLAGLQIEVDAVQGFDARKDLRDAAQLQNGIGHTTRSFLIFPLDGVKPPEIRQQRIALSCFPAFRILTFPGDFGDFLHFCRSALYNLHNVANHVLEESVLFPSYLV